MEYYLTVMGNIETFWKLLASNEKYKTIGVEVKCWCIYRSKSEVYP
jgi:hypothetical protein